MRVHENVKKFKVVSDGGYWAVKAEYYRKPQIFDVNSKKVEVLNSVEELHLQEMYIKSGQNSKQKAEEAAKRLTLKLKETRKEEE